MVATFQQEKLCHLIGWSGCNNAQTAWSFNNSVWVNLVKCTTANMKHEFIKTHFCLPLQAQYGRDMDFTKHQGFSKMLETFSFRPTFDREASKVTHGLSPLCFFDLQKGALNSTNYYDTLNRQASVTTTSDMEKARLGQPIIPRSPQELLAVLNQMIICLQFMFGMLCGLAQEVTTIYKLLDQ